MGLIIGGVLFYLRYRRRAAAELQNTGEAVRAGEEGPTNTNVGPYPNEKVGQDLAADGAVPSEQYTMGKTRTMSELESPIGNRAELEAARVGTVKREMSLKELP